MHAGCSSRIEATLVRLKRCCDLPCFVSFLPQALFSNKRAFASIGAYYTRKASVRRERGSYFILRDRWRQRCAWVSAFSDCCVCGAGETGVGGSGSDPAWSGEAGGAGSSGLV